MSQSRRLPRTDEGRKRALDLAKGKKDNTPLPDIVLSTNTQGRLDVTQPDFEEKMQDRDDALSLQAVSTNAKDIAMPIAKNYISDFIQTFNSGVARGIFPKEHRPYYHLDVESSSVPPMNNEAAVIEWGKWLIDGDPRRIAAGGAPMAMPTIADVSAKYTIFINANNSQSTKKDAYDVAQEVVAAMRTDVDALILRMWNEIETAFDNETIESRRRNAREWGVVYVSTTKSTISGTVTDAATGLALSNVSVTLVESEDTVLTDATGFYKLSTGFVGTGTLEFALTGYVTQTFPVEVTEGGALTQDAVLAAV